MGRITEIDPIKRYFMARAVLCIFYNVGIIDDSYKEIPLNEWEQMVGRLVPPPMEFIKNHDNLVINDSPSYTGNEIKCYTYKLFSGKDDLYPLNNIVTDINNA